MKGKMKMRSTILLIIFLIMNVQLAFAEDNATYLSEGSCVTVIKDSNNAGDVGYSVVLHQTTDLDSGPQFLCYIFNQVGEKIQTIR